MLLDWAWGSVALGCLAELVDAALASLDGLVVKDGHEFAAALGRGHSAPSGASFGAGAKGNLDGRRELVLGFHGGEEALGHLLAAAHAGGFGFDAVDPFADFASGVFGEGGVIVAESGFFVEQDG